jgi:hypothetical protein
MTDKREKSRQEWEQEIVSRQQNITPADFPEGVHYAKIEGIPGIISQVRFWLGIVLLAIGVNFIRSSTSAAKAVAAFAIAAGLFVTITAMRWKDTR